MAFLPQFVDQSKGMVALQMILLGLMFDTSGTSVNVIATLAGHVNDTLRKRPGFACFQKLLPAGIFIALRLIVALR